MSPAELRRERERRRRSEYRETILRAAETVITRKGYSAATMDDVAREAQFSKATVYKYFPSKSELVFEIMLHYFDVVGERIDAVRKEKTSAREKLRRSIRAALEFYEEKRNISRVLMMDQGMLKFLRIFAGGHSKAVPPSGRKDIRLLMERRRDVQKIAAKIIEEGIANKEFRPVDPMAAVTFIDAIGHGYAHGLFWADKIPDPGESADMIYAFVFNGIKNPGKAGKETLP
jgi:AcrR family transcriptional regulator